MPEPLGERTKNRHTGTRGKVEYGDDYGRADTATRTPGTRLLFLSSTITMSAAAPTANAVQFVFRSTLPWRWPQVTQRA